MKIDGEWGGYYIDPSRVPSQNPEPGAAARGECPISATFVTHGEQLTGTMVDELTDWALPVRELLDKVRESGRPLNEEKWEAFIAKYPGAEYRTTLPPKSVLKGTFQPPIVRFVKHYQGGHKQGWIDDDREHVDLYNLKHRVRYVGELSEDGSVIEGEWMIEHQGVFGPLRKPRHKGVFRLVRVAL